MTSLSDKVARAKYVDVKEQNCEYQGVIWRGKLYFI